jgi:hypothetical protein
MTPLSSATARWIEPDPSGALHPAEFRLDERCCFVKLCTRKTVQPFSEGLMAGFYLPLAYWNCLGRAGALIGPRGGTVLTHESVGRNINNTFFVELVQRGWVGSHGVTSAQIGDVIRTGLPRGRSLVLASGERPARRSSRPRHGKQRVARHRSRRRPAVLGFRAALRRFTGFRCKRKQGISGSSASRTSAPGRNRTSARGLGNRCSIH